MTTAEEDAILARATGSYKPRPLEVPQATGRAVPEMPAPLHEDKEDSLEGALSGLEPGTPLFVTFANEGYLDFLVNWVRFGVAAGLDPMVVGAMDAKVLHTARAMGVRAFSMEHTIHSFGWGAQIGIIEEVLGLGFHVLMSDVDVVWLRDPLPYFEGTEPRRKADLLVSSDCASSLKDEAEGKCILAPFNIGIMYWRSTALSKALAKEWGDGVRKAGGMTYMGEQGLLNEIVRGKDGKRAFPTKAVPGSDKDGRGAVLWSRMPEGELAFGMLPVGLFTHGHNYFVSGVPQSLGLHPYCVHATYQFGSGKGGQQAGKRQRFREAGLWMGDPDEYYTGGSSYITWAVGSRLDDWIGAHTGHGAELVDKHMAAVQFHLLCLRNALALGKLLKRAVVLPRMQCYCDRHWTPILPACKMANSDLEPPFWCPLDHIVEVKVLLNNMGGVEVKEQGFLQHARVPGEVKSSVAFASVGPLGNSTAPPAADDGRVHVAWPAHASDAEAKSALEAAGAASARVLEFDGMEHAFCGWAKKEDNDKFNKLLYGPHYGRHGAGALNSNNWCCENTQKGGYRPSPRPFHMPPPLECPRGEGSRRRARRARKL